MFISVLLYGLLVVFFVPTEWLPLSTPFELDGRIETYDGMIVAVHNKKEDGVLLSTVCFTDGECYEYDDNQIMKFNADYKKRLSKKHAEYSKTSNLKRAIKKKYRPNHQLTASSTNQTSLPNNATLSTN